VGLERNEDKSSFAARLKRAGTSLCEHPGDLLKFKFEAWRLEIWLK
jgi:hypothetical protein